MPTITALKIVTDAKTILQETTGVRWPDAELLGWVSAGQREIVMLVPSAYTFTASFIPAAGGTRQVLPPNAYAFVDISGCNAGSTVTPISKQLLDLARRNWRSEPTSPRPLHYVYDPRSPREFHLYPMPDSTVVLDLVYSVAPPELTSLAQIIALDDVYANPLTDYVLYRAYSKDLETVGSAERAVAHRTAFENTLGLKAQAMASSQPTPAAR